MKGFTVSAVEMKDAKKKGPAHTRFTAWIVIMPYSKYILGVGGMGMVKTPVILAHSSLLF